MEDLQSYKTEKLGNYILDIAAGPFGSNLKVDCFVPDGFPIIDGANLKDFKVTDNVTKFVTEKKARSLHRSIAKRNDVIVTISGTVGQISYIPKDSKYKEYLVSQRQFRVTFDDKRVYVPYLVYYFHTKEGQHKILSFANQTGVPVLAQPLKNFRNIDISLPDISIQKRIAAILESIDNKIALNNRINHNLEEQAHIQFEAWCAECKEKKPIRELSSNILDYTANINKKVILLNSSDVTEGRFESLPYVDNQNLKGQFKKRFMKGDILYSEIRPRNHHYAICYFNAEEYIASTRLMVIRKNNKMISSDALLYQYLLMPSVLEEFTSKTESRSGTFPQGNYEDLSASEVPYSKDNFQISNTLEAIYGIIWSNLEENKRLTSLRDSLLPKLMSGQITC